MYLIFWVNSVVRSVCSFTKEKPKKKNVTRWNNNTKSSFPIVAPINLQFCFFFCTFRCCKSLFLSLSVLSLFRNLCRCYCNNLKYLHVFIKSSNQIFYYVICSITRIFDLRENSCFFSLLSIVLQSETKQQTQHKRLTKNIITNQINYVTCRSKTILATIRCTRDKGRTNG